MFNIKTLEEFEKLSKDVKWQYFEKLVAFVFEKNGFETEQNVVLISRSKKRQFDVVAKRYDKVFVVECKKWKKWSAEKRYAIKNAVNEHKERCKFYSRKIKIRKLKKKYIPLVVTLMEEDILNREGVFIVPISKLKWFLGNFENFL